MLETFRLFAADASNMRHVLRFNRTAEAVLSERYSVDGDAYHNRTTAFAHLVGFALFDNFGIDVRDQMVVIDDNARVMNYSLSIIGLQESMRKNPTLMTSLITKANVDVEEVLRGVEANFPESTSGSIEPEVPSPLTVENMEQIMNEIKRENPDFAKAVDYLLPTPAQEK